MGNISDLIKNVVSNNQTIQTFAAKVIEINRETEKPRHSADDAYTVNIMRADGAIIKNVRLKASIQDKEEGVLIIPKIDSWVLASVIDGVETRAFISQYSEVDRLFGRIQVPNTPNQAASDPKLFLDYSANGEKLHIRYIKTDPEAQTDDEKIIDVAKIEFDKDHNFKISYFDEDEKALAITHFTKDSLTATFNSIKDDAEHERLAVKLTKEAVSLKFTNEEDKKRTSLVMEPGKISGNLFDENENEKLTFEVSSAEKAEIKLTEAGDTILLEKDKIQLKKNDSNLIELQGTTAINKKTAGDINIEGTNINMKASGKIDLDASGDTIIKGANVKIN